MSQIKKNKNRSFWRSEEELSGSEDFKKFAEQEFQKDQGSLTDPISRRSFIKLMGATAALAGVTGCGLRKPVRHTYPYAKMPENVIPGKATYYATALQLGTEVVGVVVESHEGRPTKVEGNPLHSRSLGAANTFHQASILNLYDPDRLKQPEMMSKPKSLSQFKTWINDFNVVAKKNQGKGVYILTGSVMSPTEARLLSNVKKKFPEITIGQYDAVNTDNSLQGLHKLAGKWIVPEYRFDKAKIVVSLDSDFLGIDPDNVINSRRFSETRDPDNTKQLSRLYVFENQFTVTGGKADHRFMIKASDCEKVVWLLLGQLVMRLSNNPLGPAFKRAIEFKQMEYSSLLPKNVIKAIADDIIGNLGKSILIAGPKQSEHVHALVGILNQICGNESNTIDYRELDKKFSQLIKTSSMDTISNLYNDLRDGKTETLFILNGNPVFNAPGNADLNSILEYKNDLEIIHLTSMKNETSTYADWVIPSSHPFESWGDLTAIDGSVSLVQPLIAPMGESLTSIELLNLLLSSQNTSDESVQITHEIPLSQSSSKWKKWLHNGVVKQPSKKRVKMRLKAGELGVLLDSVNKKIQEKNIELVVNPSYSIYDGRFNNNGWLQELPDPVTKFTWDNAALISKKTAEKFAVKSNDIIKLTNKDGKSIEIVAFIAPGQSDNSISVTMGYGRAITGRVGEGTGFNVSSIRQRKNYSIIEVTSIDRTGKTYELASTQNHGSMENRPLFRQNTLDEYKKNPNFANEMVTVPETTPLVKEQDYSKGHQWGMVLDLNKCTGCNACITACQSENNIPIVGKREVLNGREMHWIRLDRYYEGEGDDVQMVHQPNTCLHCENAPCESVCPVAATSHTPDGLNAMTYNRCVGTRYCSNNCPTKVRRFNYFDYNQRNPQAVKNNKDHLFDYVKEPDPLVQNQFNPDVTVRMRGVMEKCTYCIQRIKHGKNEAKLQGEVLKDGAIQTACMQTCPTNAITFGDINDKNSKVSKLRKKKLNYQLLEELYLKARTTYIANVVNPNPSLSKGNKQGAHV